ncbi:V-set and immunoglobulin domain-containing protein 10-like [Polypterus senegalus]
MTSGRVIMKYGRARMLHKKDNKGFYTMTWTGHTLAFLALLVIVLVPSPSDGVTISVIGSPVNGLVDGSATLSIFFMSSSHPAIAWQVNEITIVSWEVGLSSSLRVTSNYKGRVTTYDNGSITISPLKLTDTNVYSVSMTATGEKPGMNSVSLQVYAMIEGGSIAVNPQTPSEGKPLVLTYVTTQGDGAATWKLNGVPLANDSNHVISDHSLIINSASQKDNGVYTCLLENPFSSQAFNTTVTVAYGPNNVAVLPSTFSNSTPISYALVGNNVSLQCSADSYPPATILWSVPNSPNNQLVNRNPLNLTNIQANQAGNYTCTAYNSARGSGATSSYALNVYQYPASNISCSVSTLNLISLQFLCAWPGAIPAASLSFVGLNPPVTGAGSLTTVVDGSSAPNLKGKTVTCVGVHPLLAKNCSLQISGPPAFSPLHTATLDPTSGNVSLMLFYPINVQPPATFQWFKNGTQLNSGGKYVISNNSSVLTVLNLNTSTDLVTYSCVGSSPVGNQTNTFQLTGPAITRTGVVANSNRTIITLTWEIPLTSVVSGFLVQKLGPALQRSFNARDTSPSWETIHTKGPSDRSDDVLGLNPDLTYQFRVIPALGQTQGSPSVVQTIGPAPTGLSPGAIAGIVVGSVFGFLLLLLLLLLLICCCCCRRREKRDKKEKIPAGQKPVQTRQKTQPVRTPNPRLVGGVIPMSNGVGGVIPMSNGVSASARRPPSTISSLSQVSSQESSSTEPPKPVTRVATIL